MYNCNLYIIVDLELLLLYKYYIEYIVVDLIKKKKKNVGTKVK